MLSNKTYPLLFLLLLLFSCGGKKESLQPGKPFVVASTSIVADMVATIGDTLISVHRLMGPGVDPHLYKASAGDVSKLNKAQAIFYNGLHLEAKMADLFNRMAEQKISIAIAESIDSTELFKPSEYEGLYDPHIWFNPQLWSQATHAVEQGLSTLLPEQAEIIAQNARMYRDSIAAVHQLVHELVETIPPQQRILITAHDAFGYFGKAYGFEVLGLQGISTAAEAGTRDVQSLVNLIVEKQIRAIFVESSVPARNIQAVQQGVQSKGHHVIIGGELFSDALGSSDSPAATYLEMVLYNARTIAEALGGKG